MTTVTSPSSSTFPPFGGGLPPGPAASSTPSSTTGNGLNSLSGAKELWIFWYGDTPPELTHLVSPEILTGLDVEHGSWENGLSYECRSLLFKALHNLIERYAMLLLLSSSFASSTSNILCTRRCRCLLSRDFVRLGKWFVQPQEGVVDLLSTTNSNAGAGTNQRDGINDSAIQQQQHATTSSSSDKGGGSSSSSPLSFSISFFVHGESTVCASIDVRQHPAVRRISQRHVAAAQASNGALHGTVEFLSYLIY